MFSSLVSTMISSQKSDSEVKKSDLEIKNKPDSELKTPNSEIKKKKKVPYGACRALSVRHAHTEDIVRNHDVIAVRLGDSSLRVSRLILGCMTYGSKEWLPWLLGEKEGIEHIKAACVRTDPILSYFSIVLTMTPITATTPGFRRLTPPVYVGRSGLADVADN